MKRIESLLGVRFCTALCPCLIPPLAGCHRCFWFVFFFSLVAFLVVCFGVFFLFFGDDRDGALLAADAAVRRRGRFIVRD